MAPIPTPDDELTFLPPVAKPSKIVCVGLNYRLHAQEGGVAVPTRPVLFAKFPNTLIGHGEPIVYPRVTDAAGLRGRAGGDHRSGARRAWL